MKHLLCICSYHFFSSYVQLCSTFLATGTKTYVLYDRLSRDILLLLYSLGVVSIHTECKLVIN